MTIPSYLINLTRDPERLAEMLARFRALGIAFTRVDAVDGKMMTAAELDTVRAPHRAWLPLKPNEVACALSHHKCWQMIADGAASHGCVFEDDMLFSPRLSGFLSDAAWIPVDADIVKIEESFNRIWIDVPPREVGQGFRLGRVRSTHYRAGAYIVSRTGAKRLLAMTERISLPLDLIIFDYALGKASRLVTYQMFPALAVQKKGAALEEIGSAVGRSDFKRRSELARQGRRYAEEFRKLGHRLRGRRRTAIGFDES